jgi:hypothetical protein
MKRRFIYRLWDKRTRDFGYVTFFAVGLLALCLLHPPAASQETEPNTSWPCSTVLEGGDLEWNASIGKAIDELPIFDWMETTYECPTPVHRIVPRSAVSIAYVKSKIHQRLADINVPLQNHESPLQDQYCSNVVTQTHPPSS